MKSLTNHSALAEALSAQPVSNSSVAEADMSAMGHLLFHRLDGITGDTIRLPVGADGQTIIDIFRRSSFSAVLHGASRYFLEIMKDMAPRGIDPAAESLPHLESWWRQNARAVAAGGKRTRPDVALMAKDVLAALERGTTGSPFKDAAVDAGMQHSFARAAEIYLIEGKAPSPEMRGVFEQFRDWLLSVYIGLASRNVTLAPDVAVIFFRMLASDTAIETAQKDIGGDEPIFANAQDAGLTQLQYDRLLKQRALASEEAKARLLRQMMEPVRRERHRAYKTEKATVRAAVENEINATGLYRAIEWMTNHRWLGDEATIPAGTVNLDKANLVARYGAAILEALPQGEQTIYTDHGGFNPDIVADLFGLGSGDELIAAMALAPKREDAIALEVERIMAERHGDMLIDGSAGERAIAALHNDKRAEWLAAELEALIEVAGIGDGLTVSEARAYALSATSDMQVGDAMAGERFLAAGRRPAAEAARLGDALAQDEVWRDRAGRRIAGNADTASHPEEDVRIGKLITAKRRQLFNHAIYAESLEIVSEVEKFEAQAESLASGLARAKLAEAVLRDNGRIDYLGATDALLDRYGLGGRTRERTSGQDDPRAALRNYILSMKAAGRENELAIPDSVLIGSARQSYKTITLERLRAVAAASRNIEHAAWRAGKLMDADHEADVEETVSRLIYAVKRFGSAEPAKRARFPLDPDRAADALLREIDATGTTYQAIKAPLDSAASRLALDKQKAAVDLAALYDVYSPEEISRMALRRYLPALGRSLSKWEAIAIALNTGNEANRRRLTDRRIEDGLDETGLDAVLASLDERDAGFVQSVWDYLAAFQSDIAARERRLTGIAPQWVQPISVTIAGKVLKGGYYPLAYDGAHASRDLSQALMSGRFAKSATETRHGRSPTDVTARPLDLDIAVLHRHINHLLYDLKFSEPLSNAKRLLNEPGIRAAFTETDRITDFDRLQEWLDGIGIRELRSADLVGSTATPTKKNVTAAILAGNFATTFLRQAGLAEIIVATGRREFIVGLDAAFQPDISDEIIGRSPVMAERRKLTNAAATLAAEGSTQAESITAWERMNGWLAGALHYRFIELPVWLALYHQGLHRFGDDVRAIAHADGSLKRMSGRSTSEQELCQGEIPKLFTALGSYLAHRVDISSEGGGNHGNSAATRQGISLAMDIAGLFTMDAVLTAAITSKPDAGKHEGDWPTFLAKHTGYSVMSTLPFIRDSESDFNAFEDGAALAAIIDASRVDETIRKSDIPDIIAATGLAAALPAEEFVRRVEKGLRRMEPHETFPSSP